jgi:hypothetical protein
MPSIHLRGGTKPGATSGATLAAIELAVNGLDGLAAEAHTPCGNGKQEPIDYRARECISKRAHAHTRARVQPLMRTRVARG